VGVGDGPRRIEVFDAAEEIRITHHQRGGLVGEEASGCIPIGPAVGGDGRQRDCRLGVEALHVRANGLDVLRMQSLADHHVRAPLGPTGHQDGFGGGTRAVVHRRVGDVGAEELAHDGLELEDRLKRPL